MTSQQSRAVGSDPTSARFRLAFLDGIRGLAALYVVLHHTYLGVWDGFPRNTGPWLVGWLVFGHLGVAVFIVVSGFSLGMAPARRDHRLPDGARTFIRRRAYRILPPYWAALAVSVLVAWVVTGQMFSGRAVLVHALLLQDVVDSPKPNGAFWSIAIEWQIYFLFPLVLWVYRRAGRWSMVAAATGSAVLVHLAAQVVPRLAGLDHLLPQFFAMFVMGVLAADSVRGPRSPRTRLLALGGGVCAAVGVAAGLLGGSRVVPAYFWVDLLVGAGTALALAGLCDARRIRLRDVLGSRLLAGMGRFSYSTYLIHAPVVWVVGSRLALHTSLRGVPLFLITLAICIPVVLASAYAFHLVFERPFMRYRSLAELRGRYLPRGAEGRHARPRGRARAIPTPRPAPEPTTSQRLVTEEA